MWPWHGERAKNLDPAFPLNVLMCDEMVLLMVALFRCQKTVTTHRWLREYSQWYSGTLSSIRTKITPTLSKCEHIKQTASPIKGPRSSGVERLAGLLRPQETKESCVVRSLMTAPTFIIPLHTLISSLQLHTKPVHHSAQLKGPPWSKTSLPRLLLMYGLSELFWRLFYVLIPYNSQHGNSAV